MMLLSDSSHSYCKLRVRLQRSMPFREYVDTWLLKRQYVDTWLLKRVCRYMALCVGIEESVKIHGSVCR